MRNSSSETTISNFEFTYTASSQSSISLDAVVIDGSIGAGEYAYTVVLDTAFTLHYTVDGDTIYMGVDATATGWASIGWGEITDRMDGFDYIIAYYDTSFNIQDSYGSASNNIAADTTPNIISSAGTESAGHTIFEFSRLLDTGDSTHDVKLYDGEPISIHWGYDATDDFISYHDAAGIVTQSFDSIIIDGTIDAGEYAYTEALDPSFDLYYTVIGNYIYMAVDATATGWASIGWGTVTNKMLGLDYIIAYYDTAFHIQDSYGSASNNIAVDTTDNIEMSDGTESGGQTIFEFKRLLNTGDTAHDVAITPNTAITVQWGYDASDDFVSYHDGAGTATVTFIATIVQPTIDADIEPGEYAHVEFLDATFIMYYTILDSTLYMGIDATETGWASIGWGTIVDTMLGFDYVIAYYDVGFYIQDSYGSASNNIIADTSSDISSSAGTETATNTIFEFTRPLNTGDSSHDVPIVVDSAISVHWGHDPKDDFTSYHNSAGIATITFSSSGSLASEPDAISDLAASSSSGQVDLTWTVPGDGGDTITSQTVYRSTTSGSGYTQIASVGAAASSYSDTTVVAGNTYYYVVTATNSIGEGANSNEQTGNTIPSAPTVLTSTPAVGQVDLDWVAPNDGGSAITQFNVLRSTTQGSGYSSVGTPVSNSYSDTTVIPGTTYYYVVNAQNLIGTGSNSNEASGAAPTAPTAPQNPGISIGDTELTLTWSAPSSDGNSAITGYTVYRSATSGSGFSSVATLGVVLTWTDMGLTNGDTWFYLITATNAVGESADSSEVSGTPATNPNVPTSVVATYGAAEVTIDWIAPVDDGGSTITDYNIYRSTSLGGPYSYTGSSGGALTYNDTGLTNGVTYYFVVRAVNSIGESANSAETSATPLDVPTAPQSPSASNDAGSVNLSWTTPASDGGTAITGYRIYRSTTSGSYGAALVTLGVQTSYVDNTGLTNGVEYFYIITAINAEGDGLASAEVSAIPATIATAPQNVATSHSDGSITITWDAPSDDGGLSITGYKVLRSDTQGGPYLPLGSPAVTSYTDSGLVNGDIWYYVIVAVNAEGDSPNSAEVSDASATVPGVPTSVSISHGDGSITISWAAPLSDGGSTVTGYKIYRSLSSGSYGTELNSTASLSYTDLTVTNGVQYYYVVKAVNIEGDSTNSAEVSDTPATLPTAPVLSISHGNGNINLTWSEPANGGSVILGYKIYRSLTSGSYGAILDTTASLNYNDTGLTNGFEYFYVVKSYNAEGDSANSGEVSDTPATITSAPQSLGRTFSDSEVILTWSAPASTGGSNVTGYKVYRSEISGTYGSELAILGIVLTYTDSTVNNGVEYFYVVVSINAEGESPYSNEISVIPGTAPDAPSSPTANKGDSQVILNWTVPNSNGYAISNYKIYKSTTQGSGHVLLASPVTNSYVDSAVVNGVTYYYLISAVNFLGESAVSSEVSATPATISTAPQSLDGTHGDAQIDLTWSAPSSTGGSPITGYNVYRSTSSGSYGAAMATLGVVYSYSDNASLTNGVTYYYSVSAVNAEGESSLSNELTIVPSTTPTVPLSVVSTPGDGTVDLTWSAPSSDGGATITVYHIYRSETSGSGYVEIGTNTTAYYTDDTVVNAQDYYYVITAENLNGESAYSDESPATPTGPPSEPLSLAGAVGDGFVDLTWLAPPNDGGSNITGYKIYRSQTSGSYGATLASLGVVLLYNDTTAVNGESYYYVVTAINANGESVYSAEILVTLANVPTEPLSLASGHGDSSISLTWFAPADIGGSAITEYRIYRSLTSGSGYSQLNTSLILSYIDTNVTNGVTYYYKVTAVNSDGEGPFSSEVSDTPATVPGVPSTVVATSGNTEISLTWDVPASDGGSSITLYRILRSTTQGSGHTEIDTTAGTSYTDTLLTNGDEYYYLIIAVNAEGDGLASSEASAIPSTVPDTPTGLLLTPGISQISISWTAPADDGGAVITVYHIYRSLISGSSYSEVDTTAATSYIDSTVTNGNEYFYVITAENAKGESVYSTENSEVAGLAPTEPQNVAAVSSDGQVDLSWEAPSSNGGLAILEYRIYRSTTSGTNYSLLASPSGSTYAYSDDTVTNGVAYYYVISAVNSIDESTNSSEVTGDPGSVPSAPQSPSTSSGDSTITISWSVPSDNGGFAITVYHIYRSLTSGSGFAEVGTSATLSYTDNTVSNGVTYHYYVTAENSLGEGSASSETSALPSTVPDAIDDLVATKGDASVSLSWSEPGDGGLSITGYIVYRSTTQGSGYVEVGTPLTTSFADSGLTNGQTYYYVVVASNSNGDSSNSNEGSAMPSSVPGAPLNLDGTASLAQIDLIWDAPSDDGGLSITGYKLYRSDSSGGPWTEIASIATTSHSDGSLVNGQTYYYVVSAINADGEGSLSLEFFATPGAVSSEPLNLAAVDGNAQVSLSWDAPSTNNGFIIISYSVYRSETSGGPWGAAIATPTGTSFIDSTVTNGVTYYYIVTATNSQGESGASNEASALPGTTSSAPTNLAAVTGYDYVDLSWDAPTSDGGLAVTDYEIYRSTTSGSGFALLVSVAGDVFTYSDTAVTLGIQYYYHIVAINPKGSSTTSLEVNGLPGGAPDAVNDLIIESRNSQIVINWTAPFDGGFAITGYEVWRLNETSGLLELLGTVSILYYFDNGLPNGQTFTYHIIAVNLLGNSLESNYVTGTPSTIADEPTDQEITFGDGELTITWEVPDDGGSTIIEYNIYRTDSIDGTYELIDTSITNLYVDTNVTNGQEYFYKISTVTANGESLLSLFIYATPMAVPDCPENVSTVFDGVDILVSWDVPFDQGSTITNYLVFRSEVTNSSFVLVGNVTIPSYLDDNITLGTDYFYKVCAVNSIGDSILTDQVSLLPANEPDAPVLTHTVDGESIILDWNTPEANGMPIVTYTVYRAIDSGTFAKLVDVVGNIYNDSDLEADITYSYAVSATNIIGEGEFSNTVIQLSPVIVEEPTSDPTEPTDNTLPTTTTTSDDVTGNETDTEEGFKLVDLGTFGLLGVSAAFIGVAAILVRKFGK